MKHFYGSIFLDVIVTEPDTFAVEASGAGLLRRIVAEFPSRDEAELWMSIRTENGSYGKDADLCRHERMAGE